MAESTKSKSGGDTPRGGSEPKNTERTPRTATMSLPFVTATFRMPDVRLPGRDELNFAVSTARPYLPSPQQAVYYGGLAALAALELLEWPVALAIGAGTALVQQSTVTTSPRKTAAGSQATGSQASNTSTKT